MCAWFNFTLSIFSWPYRPLISRLCDIMTPTTCKYSTSYSNFGINSRAGQPITSSLLNTPRYDHFRPIISAILVTNPQIGPLNSRRSPRKMAGKITNPQIGCSQFFDGEHEPSLLIQKIFNQLTMGNIFLILF